MWTRGELPKPLTPEEMQRVLVWEWWTIRICLGALAALVGLIVLGHWIGGETLARRLIALWFVALIPIAIFSPLREGCPRCRQRLSQMWRFRLPDHCRRCGVEFPRPDSAKSPGGS